MWKYVYRTPIKVKREPLRLILGTTRGRKTDAGQYTLVHTSIGGHHSTVVSFIKPKTLQNLNH